MAAGETIMEGAVAYLMGEQGRGLKHMMDQVNLSRLSHGFRAAGMMRRCLNEAMVAARHRNAFAKPVVEHPLMRRQLLKIMVPTEQALSATLYAAAGLSDRSERSRSVLRLLTPVGKYRACRDNVTVATAAMEVRGGNGYIEDWPNSRLVRDAHLGLLWEGTSNILALDAVHRAIRKDRAHLALRDDLDDRLAEVRDLPGQFRTRLEAQIDHVVRFAEEVASHPEHERHCRVAAAQLYHATTAVLLASEGMRIGAAGGDARRLLLARCVTEHRLQAREPTDLRGLAWEDEAADLLLSDDPVPLDRAVDVLVA